MRGWLWLAVVSCAGPEAAGPGPSELALGAPTDFHCEAEPAGALSAPEPWIAVGSDWLDYLDWFRESPYANGKDPFRGIHDLAVHRGQLHVGVGDIDANPGSTFCPDAGGPCTFADEEGHGIPVFTVEPSGGVGWSLVVQEEVVTVLRRSGDALLVAGNDPTEGDGKPACARGKEPTCPDEVDRDHPSFALGHVYLGGATWTVSRDMPHAWHVLDIAWHGGVLFAAGSGAEGGDKWSDATIWRSEDGGLTWTIDLALRDDAKFHERFWVLVPVGERLYAWGARFSDVSSRRNTSQVWDGERWTAAPDFLDGYVGSVESEPFSEEASLVWGRWSDGVRTYRRADRIDASGSEEIRFFTDNDWSPVDAHLRCEGDLWVLVERRGFVDGDEWAVFRTEDLVAFEEVLTWSSPAAYTSLAVWEGGLVLGDALGRLHRTP